MIKPGQYIPQVENKLIVDTSKSSGALTLAFRVELFRSGGKRGERESVGTLTHFCSLASPAAAKVTINTLEACGATRVKDELPLVVAGKVSSLTGFGSAGGARVTLSYEEYGGKKRSRMSFWAERPLKAKSEPTNDAVANAISALDGAFAPEPEASEDDHPF